MADDAGTQTGGASTDPGASTQQTTSQQQTTSDDQSPDALMRALRSERATRGAAEKRAKDLEDRLKAIEDRDKTEAQREREAREAAERERDELRTARLRDRIAAEEKLPGELADRLQGATEDEMRADAKRLAGLLRPAGSLGGGQGGAPPPSADDMNSQIRKAFGRPG